MATKGTKKSPISKEQLEREMKLAQSRKLIKEQFYPALQEATISVDEATQLLNAAISLIMEEAMETLRTRRMSEIRDRIVNKLCPNDERLLQIEKLMEIFDMQTLFEARGHLESMKAVISQMQIDEMRNRKLDTFTPDWGRYLN